MKRTKRLAALLVCVTIIFTFLTPTVAAYDNGTGNGYPANGTPNGNGSNGGNGDNGNGQNGDNGSEPGDPNGNGQYGGNGSELEERIGMLEGMLTELLAFLDELSRAGEVDHAAIDRQIREAADLERFMLRLEYYNVCSIIASTDLLRRQRTLTERQLELERVRLSLGFSTQSNVDALTAYLNSLRRQIELNDDIVQIKKPPVNSIGNFGIPAPASPIARTVDELRTALIRNNAALFVIDRQINQMNRQNAPWAEIRLLRTQRELLVRQLEMAAANAWTAYLTAKAQYDLAQAARSTLASRLNMIDELFRIGEISAIARLEQRYAVYEELHGADMAAIALAVAVAELDFMMMGVVGR